MIVWLASYPRSGNTFFRILLNNVYGVKTFSVHDDPLLEQIGVADIVGHEKLPDDINALRESSETHFVKTHRLPEPGDVSPAVYIIRDGRDALVSHAKYVLSFQKKKTVLKSVAAALGYDDFPRTLRKLIVEEPRYGGWGGHARKWLDQRGEAPAAVARYEDLLEAPQREVERSLTEVGVRLEALTDGKVPDFAALQARSPEFFRKGKTGSWREEMPPELQELFLIEHGDVMRRFGYLPAEAGT